MSFEDPIVAGEELVVDSIQSPDFAAGSTGWSINRDGSAEFNEAALRGQLQVGGSAFPYQLFGGPIPTEIEFDPDGFPVLGIAHRIVINADQEIIRCYSDTSGGPPFSPKIEFWEVAIDRNAASPVMWRSSQRVSNGTSEPIFRTDIGWSDAVDWAAHLRTVYRWSALYIGSDSNIAGSQNPSQAPLFVDGISAPRGMRLRVDSAANSAAIGAEAVLLTTPGGSPWNTRQFWDGRAYEIRWKMGIQGSVANATTVRVRRTNAAGQLLGSWQWATTTTAQDFAGRVTVIRPAGAGNLLSTIALTLQASAGTSTALGSSTSVRDLEVWDIGSAADYPTSIAIV